MAPWGCGRGIAAGCLGDRMRGSGDGRVLPALGLGVSAWQGQSKLALAQFEQGIVDNGLNLGPHSA